MRKNWKLIICALVILGAFFGFAKFVQEKELQQLSRASRGETVSQPQQITEALQKIEQRININAQNMARQLAPATTDLAKKITIVLNVPFTTQAPLGEWSDPRQQNGCEEAASVMAMAWVNGQTSITKDEAKKEILAIADYELKNYQSSTDTSAEDTVKRIFNGYWQYKKVAVNKRVNKQVIINSLTAGNLVLAPTDGQLLDNPYYTPPGPTTHMLVVMGYDPTTDEFITDDPGTRRGEKYRYSSEVLLKAIVDYPTGDHLPQDASQKAIIIVSR